MFVPNAETIVGTTWNTPGSSKGPAGDPKGRVLVGMTPICSSLNDQRNEEESSTNASVSGSILTCGFCQQGFSTYLKLKRHESLHTEKRPLNVCKICNKNFTRAFDLRRHERIHTGDRPYKCKFCCKSFSQGSNLYTHERIHTGYRPFVCNICNKSFFRSTSLRKHERIHTERPFVCL